jgi:hypothetical protein
LLGSSEAQKFRELTILSGPAKPKEFASSLFISGPAKQRTLRAGDRICEEEDEEREGEEE